MTSQSDGSHAFADTTCGPIRGQWHHGVARFAGIPFAAPPVGELRFRPPVAPEPWTEVRSAEFFGPVCPQNPSMMDALFGSDSEQWNEDCLYLNVWTTISGEEAETAEPLPVMVWIHGGGFEMGSGSSPMYDGTHFAQSGVVIVTVNYRLGSLGFLELGHLDADLAGSGNVGLLDQVAALEWVRDNIASFGGDPANVTVFGQSAGSMSISLLMSSRLSDGLFHKAITQSGSTSAARTVPAAQADADEFLATGGWADVDALRNAPVSELLAAHAAISGERLADPEGFLRRAANPIAFLLFRPVADGITVPTDPLAAIAAGSAAGVSLVTGSTSEEWRLFAMMSPPPATDEALSERLAMIIDDTDGALATYRAERGDVGPADLEGAVLTDLVFRIPTVRMADAQSQYSPTFQYLWDLKSEAFGGLIGAAHAIDIPFVFDLVEDQRLHIFVGADAPKQLARAVNSSWIAFARTGSPSGEGMPEWPALDPTGSDRPVMVLDTDCHLASDPQADTRKYWARTT